MSASNALAQSGSWETKASMPTARSSLQGAALNGVLYAIGGNNGRDTPIVEAYNPTTNTWSSVASLNQTNYGGDTGRYAGSAVAVNGKLYMMGGWTNSPPLPSNTLSIYNPNTNTWSAGPTIPGSGYTACTEAGVIGSKNLSVGRLQWLQRLCSAAFDIRHGREFLDDRSERPAQSQRRPRDSPQRQVLCNRRHRR
jgi:N-acetylneuraminic acid mutarotase